MCDNASRLGTTEGEGCLEPRKKDSRRSRKIRPPEAQVVEREWVERQRAEARLRHFRMPGQLDTLEDTKNQLVQRDKKKSVYFFLLPASDFLAFCVPRNFLARFLRSFLYNQIGQSRSHNVMVSCERT